jgi:hypothetical protein
LGAKAEELNFRFSCWNERLRHADEGWAKAIASKSLEQTVAMYDEEAITSGAAMPPARENSCHVGRVICGYRFWANVEDGTGRDYEDGYNGHVNRKLEDEARRWPVSGGLDERS